MNESKFQPTPEDEKFLDNLDKRFTIEEWKSIFREVVQEKYKGSIDNGSKTPAEIIADFRKAYVDADNPPEKQTAIQEILEELEKEYQL